MKCGNCFHVHLDKHHCQHCSCDNHKEAYPGQSFYAENNPRIARAEENATSPSLKDNQRQWDLLRYVRSELLINELINENEYAELAKDHPAVKRLEDYDELREAARNYFYWNESEYQKHPELSLRLKKALGL